jgi:hypothetical protein
LLSLDSNEDNHGDDYVARCGRPSIERKARRQMTSRHWLTRKRLWEERQQAPTELTMKTTEASDNDDPASAYLGCWRTASSFQTVFH